MQDNYVVNPGECGSQVELISKGQKICADNENGKKIQKY